MALILDGTDGITSSGGTNVLQDDAVITANIANGAVVAAKIADGAVSDAKIAAMAAAKLTGRVPAANVNLGGVLQVVSTIKTDVFSVTGTTTADITGLTATITPFSTSSKILVLYIITGAATGHANLTLVRNSTNIFIGSPDGSRPGASDQLHVSPNTDEAINYSGVFLDSPNTTNAVTYKFSARVFGTTFFAGRARTDINRAENPRTPCSITLMEIAA